MIATIRRFVRGLGYDVIVYRPARSRDYALQAFLDTRGVNLILDIGANVGQFGQARYESGYRGRMISFEPIASIHQQLAQTSQKYKGWLAYRACALGEQDSEAEINVSGFSPSSSLLPMTQTHLAADPNTAYVRKEKIQIRRLDDCVRDELASQDLKLFIKLDVQGYEAQVVAGGAETFKRAIGVLLEVSFAELYQGQQLFSETLRDMEALGFRIFGLYPEFANAETGQMLTADVLFYRP
jgi:FkbM family methyltransferase